MSQVKTDQEYIATTHNMARYFVQTRQVGWILLFVTLLWGFYAYNSMEKRKDPLYSNYYAVAACQWPGATADQVEQLITRRMEQKISENMKVVEIKSVSRANVSIITLKIDDRVQDTEKQFDDVALRLNQIQDLPNGAGPIMFDKDYGDVTTLMLTVASPKASDVEISIRADAIKRAIESTRLRAPPHGTQERVSIVACFPQSISSAIPRRQRDLLASYLARKNILSDVRPLDGSGFVGIDGIAKLSDSQINEAVLSFVKENLKPSCLHPDMWEPALIRDPGATKQQLSAVAGDKYSYAEMDRFTDLITRSLQTLPEVSKITRHGTINEQVNLDFSQERLASYGIQPTDLRDRLQARNICMPAGVLEIGPRALPIRTSGAFRSEKDIGSVIIATSDAGSPVYLRDLVDISRDYESPPRFLGFMNTRDNKGVWQRNRAVTLAIFMRSEEHIDKFGEAVNKGLETLKERVPDDLIFVRTSDQPEQVEENLELFMTSLYEAIALVVLTALIGFWEWRSALMIALSVPATLAMTFGMMRVLGLDIQQCSVAALIISLGLLVDDPVVAGDAIKRELSAGNPKGIAAWLGPTKLAHAIMFATITNIAAYLPFLMISGEIGQFIFSLPIVITCSLIASRIVSMTFVPLLGYYLLRAPKPKADEGMAKQAPIMAAYMKGGLWVLKNRLLIFATSVVLLIIGFNAMSSMKTAFFPNDLFRLCWVDVWLPDDAPLVATDQVAIKVEDVIKKTADEYAKELSTREGKNVDVLQSVTTFLGGSGPRFWSSMVQELDQLSYAQVIVQVADKHQTNPLIVKIQKALSAEIPEARCDVRILEGGKPVGMPIAIRISGDETRVLAEIAEKVAAILRTSPLIDRVRTDWGTSAVAVKVNVNSDRANLAGLTNADVATSSLVGLSGYQVDVMREGDKQIPIVTRLRAEESSLVQGMSDLYVWSGATQQKVPMTEVASIDYGTEREKIRRRNQFRTMTVGGFVVPGALASEAMEQVHPKLDELTKELLPGYKIEIGGEEEEQSKSFDEMMVVMITSVVSIFLCLVFQFRSAVKPLIVFAGIPYGVLGAFVGLMVMGQPFGFPAFMGVASLAGVIVSHIIVLFDFIEESREESMPLEQALLHASMVRLRPVLITVTATVLGFIPLALHGGPLWEPLCYAQIGGLTFATFITLMLVPVIYAICVKDLRIVKWAPDDRSDPGAEPAQHLEKAPEHA